MRNQDKGHLRTNIKFFRNNFLLHSSRLFALRVTISMGVLAVPYIAIGLPLFGVTLALGALAGALSETDDHPKGRIKSLSITILSFFISSFAVGLLNDYPWLLGVWFALAIIGSILIGGIDERYRTITFTSVLVGISMLGIKDSQVWYWQALLLPAGALFHGLFTLFLSYRYPWRSLDEQMASGFQALANYLEKKALCFSREKQEQARIDKDLASLNITVVNALERIKDVLKNAFTLTYLNHALLSHISALGLYRETNMDSYEGSEPLFEQINEKLLEASQKNPQKRNSFSSDLSSLLMMLREQIERATSGSKRQQLRLSYNIAATTSEIIDELK